MAIVFEGNEPLHQGGVNPAGALSGKGIARCVLFFFFLTCAEHRASKSYQELFEVCPLEEAHFMSQRDIEKLGKVGFDTKASRESI